MKYCSDCGNKIDSDSKFCNSCGNKLKSDVEKDAQHKLEVDKEYKKLKSQETKKKITSPSGLAAGGIITGSAMAMTGVVLIVVGVILTITIVGAIIGIPLMILGGILFMLSGVAAGIGIIAGIGKAIHNLINNKKSKPKKVLAKPKKTTEKGITYIGKDFSGMYPNYVYEIFRYIGLIFLFLLTLASLSEVVAITYLAIVPMIIFSIGFILLLPFFNKYSKKHFKIIINPQTKALLSIGLLIIGIIISSLVTVSDISNVDYDELTTDQKGENQVTAKSEELTEQVKDYSDSSNFIDDCYSDNTGLGVLGCIQEKAREQDNPTICNQLGNLNTYELDTIATTTYYGQVYQGCTMMIGLGDSRSANECYDEQRQNFVVEYINFCKVKYYEYVTDVARKTGNDLECVKIPKDALNLGGHLIQESCYTSAAFSAKDTSICDAITSPAGKQQCIDNVLS
jgi:hypothetical protein